MIRSFPCQPRSRRQILAMRLARAMMVRMGGLPSEAGNRLASATKRFSGSRGIVKGPGLGGGQGQHATRMPGVDGSEKQPVLADSGPLENFGAGNGGFFQAFPVSGGQDFLDAAANETALVVVSQLDHQAVDIAGFPAPLAIEEEAQMVEVG